MAEKDHRSKLKAYQTLNSQDRDIFKLTPNEQPEFLKASTAKTVDAKNNYRCPGERYTPDKSVRSGVVADIKAKCS